MDCTSPEPDRERLHPEFDAAAVIKVIRRAMRRLSRQIHQGSPCPNPTTCDVCDGLVLDGYERVLAAFKHAPDRDGWTPGYIVACARHALPDAVRKRMSRAGLVAKPDRWLGQRSFLPDAPELGRVLVIATVLSVGYFTVIPVANGQAEVTEESLQRLLTGLRCAKGGFASLRKAWRAHGGDAATTAELKAAYRQALDAWRHEQPARYAALLHLNQDNAGMGVLSLDAPHAGRPLTETVPATSPATDGAAGSVVTVTGPHGASTLFAATDAAIVADLARTMLGRMRTATPAQRAQFLARPESIGTVLIEAAAQLAARPGSPVWLADLGQCPDVVADLLESMLDWTNR